ncbi:MAG: alpha/beta hydrolase [Candidatus Limnocylindrales bacterium]
MGVEDGMTQALTQIDAILAESSSKTQTIAVEGATVAFDVRYSASSDKRPLMLIGQPMGASGFTLLAGYFGDRTIITYDPRGADRSVKDDPMSSTGPDTHADDLNKVIQEADGGPVDMFASSGGAINALALVAKYPNDVHTLVAHEPPLVSALVDSEHAAAAVRAIHHTYEQRGWGAGMAHFIALTGQKGPLTPEFVAQPGPDPQMFGMPADDDGNRTDPLLGPSFVPMTSYEPNWDAIRTASTRVILAAGEASGGQLANRGAYAVAARLGSTPVQFPGGHGGFNKSEWEPSDPEAFAAKLREVLGAT